MLEVYSKHRTNLLKGRQANAAIANCV